VDRTACLVAPRRSVLVVGGETPANRVVVLGFGEEVLADVVERYGALGVERARFDRWLTHAETLPRTVWVHEIVHRYVFEREALGEHDNLATRFLEEEIVKEVYFLFRDRDGGADRASMGHRYSAPVERAVAWIEAHLFEPCGMRELARRAGASESTLLRSFRKELACRPGEYWRTRRLDEARVMLRSGTASVAEVAVKAGYGNPTSFAAAFQKRFGEAPSMQRRRLPTKRAP
jgi:AraC-like DNA-binding protein